MSRRLLATPVVQVELTFLTILMDHIDHQAMLKPRTAFSDLMIHIEIGINSIYCIIANASNVETLIQIIENFIL